MMLIAGAAIVLVVGVIVGFMFGRRSSHLAIQLKAAESELAQTKQQLSGYQTQVSSHFQKTADLFTDLTQHYQDVYKHLALGAQTLCQDSAVQDQLRLLKSNLSTEENDVLTTEEFHAQESHNVRKEPYVAIYPRDYASEV